MAIPKDKLESWSRPGKNELSNDTYTKMETVIKNNVSNTEIFLQGSYANSTNVRDNSDIDIVVLLKGWTYSDWPLMKNVKNARDFLFNIINGKDNFQFVKGNKCVKYKGGVKYYVPADLVPCVEYSANGYDGIAIYDHGTGNLIANYPKQHRENGEKKSSDTDGNFKKTVRMFKNARNFAVDRNLLGKDHCPSYCLECLLYNVDDKCFSGDEHDVFLNVLNFLQKNRYSLSNFKTQNNIQYMFSGFDPCWNTSYAQTAIEKIAYVWNDWDKIR